MYMPDCMIGRMYSLIQNLMKRSSAMLTPYSQFCGGVVGVPLIPPVSASDHRQRTGRFLP